MTLPPFNNARGSASTLQLTPPFGFTDVTMSVLPLRADFNRLQTFCNSYLNHTDEHLVFQPLVPYVYMILLNYGKMSVEQANMGWVSQHEVAFSIPLRFSTLKDGKAQRTDWAFNSPFIFVDNELSMTTGREVYGWPKTLAQLDYAPGNWVDDPHADRQVFQLSPIGTTKVANSEKSSPLLTVYQKDIQRLTDLPLNPSSLLSPMSDLPNMMLSASRMGLDVLQTAMGVTLPSAGAKQKFPDLLNPAWYASLYNPENLARLCSPGAWGDSVKNLLWSVVPRASANTINLKQFRDASGSSTVCYQAVTNAAMQLKNIAGGGLLGPQNMALNQLDGGYYIDIHNSDQLPIVEALGLQVDKQLETRHGSTSRLCPVCPFWMKVDMHYAPGDVLLWRSRSGDWKTTDGLARLTRADSQTTEPTNTSSSTAAAETPSATTDSSDQDNTKKAASVEPSYGLEKRAAISPHANAFNSTLGMANAARALLNVAPDTTIRVLPLLATGANLRSFVSEYLNVPNKARFDHWGTHVYVVVTNFSIDRGNPFGGAESVSDRELNILVPVKSYEWYEDGDYDLSSKADLKKRDREKLRGTAVVPAFTYVNDDKVAIVRNEVDGVPTLRTRLNSPECNWMQTNGPHTQLSQGLLETNALVLPELGVGAGAKRETLLKIDTAPQEAPHNTDEQRHTMRSWGRAIVEDLTEKYAQRGIRKDQQTSNDAFRFVRALALELLAGKLPLTSLTLKQFRDAWEPDKACYQGLIVGRRTIKKLHSICEIEDPLQVSIARYPTQPIASLLGLKSVSTRVTRHGVVDYFKPIRPFWIHADIGITPSETVMERVGEEQEQWAQLQNPSQLTGWQDIESIADLQKHEANTDGTDRISYMEKNDDNWLRREYTLSAGDIEHLNMLQNSGSLKHLKLLSRQFAREIMADPQTLDHLDHNAVASPGALLDSKSDAKNAKPDYSPWTALPLGKLAGYLGEISPATVIDALLSRQWACPESHRKNIHKADYVVPVDVLGADFAAELFPEAERQRAFWPQSTEQQILSENERIGTALRLQEDVMDKIAAGSVAKEFKKSADAAMPKWFAAGSDKRPAEWSAAQWAELEKALKKLTTNPDSSVSHSEIIQPLLHWHQTAHQMHTELTAREENKNITDKSTLLGDRMKRAMGS